MSEQVTSEDLKQLSDVRFLIQEDYEYQFVVLIFKVFDTGCRAIQHLKTRKDTTIAFIKTNEGVNFAMYHKNDLGVFNLLNIAPEGIGNRKEHLDKFFQLVPDNKKFAITCGTMINEGQDLKLPDTKEGLHVLAFGYIYCEAENFQYQHLSDRN